LHHFGSEDSRDIGVEGIDRGGRRSISCSVEGGVVLVQELEPHLVLSGLVVVDLIKLNRID